LKNHALLILLVFSFVAAGGRPGYAVNKEMFQMMQQMDSLQQAVQNLQKNRRHPDRDTENLGRTGQR